MVIDASALVAIADEEPDAELFLEVFSRGDDYLMSSINAVEAGLILVGRGRLEGVDALNRWLLELRIDVEIAAPTHSAALAAYLTYGRNYHPARLNLADCFAYALAKQLNAPLLHKGDDFAKTDVRSALQPT
jgi:ribonuclease VapC